MEKYNTLLPLDVRSLFRPLQLRLFELLDAMSEADWHTQTIAKQWKVKDVVSHLLDGDLRVLSMQRDKYFGEQAGEINDYRQLVNWLNQLNADWIQASKRLSPNVLNLLHQTTGSLVCEYYENLNLNDEAIFSVDWAGESTSTNRMHLAREFTEKWHHQQQIRDAIGRPGIMSKEFFHPCMDTFMLALPFTFRNMEEDPGTTIKVTVTTDAGGDWYLTKVKEGWSLARSCVEKPKAEVIIPAELAWKLFTKGLKHEIASEHVQIKGNQRMGNKVLEMVAVMA